MVENAPGGRLLSHLPRPPRKVVVVRASRLGDFLCTGPALRALRHALPEAELAMITLPMLQDVVVRSPYLDGFIGFPGYPGIAQQFFEPRRTLDFFRRMQHERFDLAIQMQGSGVYANPFTLLLGAACTAGFRRPEDDPTLLDASLPWPEHGHEIRRLLALVRQVGAEPRGEEMTYPLFRSDHANAQSLLAGLPHPIIGLHPGSHDPRRRWPLERFVEVARTLHRRYGGSLVLLGGSTIAEEAAVCEARIPGCRNLVGRTALGPFGATLNRLALFITNDSGPAHVAYALRAPTITLYRAGGRERYGPLGDGPFAPLEPASGDVDALVSVEQALQAADTLLAGATGKEQQQCGELNDVLRYAR
jgi:ADP-heptose:LPS heptosyltransferase